MTLARWFITITTCLFSYQSSFRSTIQTTMLQSLRSLVWLYDRKGITSWLDSIAIGRDWITVLVFVCRIRTHPFLIQLRVVVTSKDINKLMRFNWKLLMLSLVSVLKMGLLIPTIWRLWRNTDCLFCFTITM